MSYLTVKDAPKPKYIVVTVFSEYEQSSHLFIDKAEAMGYYNSQLLSTETYIAELL